MCPVMALTSVIKTLILLRSVKFCPSIGKMSYPVINSSVLFNTLPVPRLFRLLLSLALRKNFLGSLSRIVLCGGTFLTLSIVSVHRLILLQVFTNLLMSLTIFLHSPFLLSALQRIASFLQWLLMALTLSMS